MEDRRSYQRFPVQLDVKLKKLDGISDDMNATVYDVSFSGLGVTASAELHPGTGVSVEWPNPPFYYPDEAVVKGTVVSIENDKEEGMFRIGVKFSDSESELVQGLLNWVQMQAQAERRSQAAANKYSDQRKRHRF